jgi:hypothetical protein
VLERIRAGEVVSRSSEACTFKSWDHTGEPYLALEAAIAAGPRMTAEDRAAFAGRLLRAQWRPGIWEYGVGIQRPDSDTTASALRALDRLGHKVGLEGLRLFYNPRTRLFHTFRRPDDRRGLDLPPQSREKHGGAHPCVLANIWLLFLERGQLKGLARQVLEPMQRADGGWHTYFYDSPHYSTRLFSELLTGFGTEHDPALERTLAALLASQPQSPTRDAEALIALAGLARRFPSRSEEISQKAKAFLAGIQSAQLADGSWPGDMIWTALYNFGPGTVDGYDHFRVRSTSLCVQALRLWQ